MMDKVPLFSTFGKNYTRRFKDTDLFEQIFSHILMECYKFKLVDPTEVFVDATHVKARDNNKKTLKEKNDRDDDDNDSTPSSGGDPRKFTDDIPGDTKTIKCSTTDPESGWFRKGSTRQNGGCWREEKSTEFLF